MRFKLLASAVTLVVGMHAHAGIMVTQLDPTDPSLSGFESISPTTADLDSAGNLSEYQGITFRRGYPANTGLEPLAPGTTSPGYGEEGNNWWASTTETIYTTGVPSTSSKIIIDFTNAANPVYEFFFQMGANVNATGWVKGITVNGYKHKLSGIALGPGNSPGILVASSGGSCDAIGKVVVEPPFTWGIFGMSKSTSAAGCAQVPEPGSLGLLGIGLLGLGMLRLRIGRQRQARA